LLQWDFLVPYSLKQKEWDSSPSQTLRRPFADPSHKLRASAQGENDNIRRRFFADAQNDKKEAQNDMREAQNDKGET